MRDILFRGMTRKPGEKVKMDGTPIPGNWVYGGIFPGDGDFSVIYQREPVEKFSVYNDTIGQYTGLCDKNGVKIFEGDIVQRNEKETFEIKWDRGGFCLSAKSSYTESGELFLPLIRIEEMEVIGNVFENQELLEKFSYEKARNDFLSECLNRRVGDDKRDN